MVTTNIKDYSNEDIIVLINGIQSGDIAYTINDLKKLLAEATNRKLDSKITNAVVSLINSEITGEKCSKTIVDNENAATSTKRPVAQKPSSDKGNDIEFNHISMNECDKFPILNFLSGLFKVLAWLILVIAIIGSVVIGYVYFKDELLYLAASVFGGIMIGTVLLIFFYAQSEKIYLQLEIERHLRRK